MTAPSAGDRARAAHIRDHFTPALDRLVTAREGQSGVAPDGVDPANMVLRQPCLAPAPLVVNGSPFVGCKLDAGHDGQHEVRIAWGDRG